MTRVNQFAKDLGISRAAALNLLNKARSRKDGGQEVVDDFARARKSADESYKRMKKEHEKADKIASDDTNMKLKAKYGKAIRRGDDEKVVKAADGKYVRGMGKACMRNPKEVKIK